MEKEYIYLLKSECGNYFKVGKSNNPEIRTQTLNKVGLFKINVEESLKYEVKLEEVFTIEKIIHKIFNKYNYLVKNKEQENKEGYTEWFEIECYEKVLGFIDFLKSVKYEINDREKLSIDDFEIKTNDLTLSLTEEKMKNKSKRDCKKVFLEINKSEVKYLIKKEEQNVNMYFENLKYKDLSNILGLFNCYLGKYEKDYMELDLNYLIRQSECKIGKMKNIYNIVINKGHNKVQEKKRFYLIKAIEEELFEQDSFIEENNLINIYVKELNNWKKLQEEKLEKEKYIIENTLPIKKDFELSKESFEMSEKKGLKKENIEKILVNYIKEKILEEELSFNWNENWNKEINNFISNVKDKYFIDFIYENNININRFPSKGYANQIYKELKSAYNKKKNLNKLELKMLNEVLNKPYEKNKLIDCFIKDFLELLKENEIEINNNLGDKKSKIKKLYIKYLNEGFLSNIEITIIKGIFEEKSYKNGIPLDSNFDKLNEEYLEYIKSFGINIDTNHLYQGDKVDNLIISCNNYYMRNKGLTEGQINYLKGIYKELKKKPIKKENILFVSEKEEVETSFETNYDVL